MRIFMKLACMSLLALAACAIPAASKAAMTKALPAIESAAGQNPLLHEVRKKRGNWDRQWKRKRFSKNRRSHRKLYFGKRYKRFHRRPSIYLRFGPYPRHYYYDDYYDEDVYYSSSCGTQSEKERCARKFKSFNWNTCKYTTYSGHKRLCPYVR